MAVQKLGLSVDIDPAQALLDEVARANGEVRYWHDVVAALNPDALLWGRTQHEEGFGPMGSVDVTTEKAGLHQAVQAWHAARDRLVTVAATALKAGVEERRVRLAENHGALIAAAVHQILTGLQLTPEQQDLVPTVVPNALRSIEP